METTSSAATEPQFDISSLTVQQLLEINQKVKSLLSEKSHTGTHGRAWLRDNPEALDWSKPNAILAKETGMEMWKISRYRRLLNADKASKYYPACKDWDWSKSNTELSRQLGVETGVVLKWRKKIGFESVKSAPKPKIIATPIEPKESAEKTDWSAANWEDYDASIAKTLGVSRERVRQMRAKLNMPPVSKNDALHKKFLATFGDSKELDYVDVNRVMKMTREGFINHCTRAGIKPLPIPSENGKRSAIHVMNWDLPNAVLAEIWKLGYQGIAGRRWEQGKPKPKWRSRKEVGPEMLQLIEVEKQKAEKWFQNNEEAKSL